MDPSVIRARLAKEGGKSTWRALEELADTDDFRALLDREFPRQASGWAEGLSRREFLSLMGASLALRAKALLPRLPARARPSICRRSASAWRERAAGSTGGAWRSWPIPRSSASIWSASSRARRPARWSRSAAGRS